MTGFFTRRRRDTNRRRGGMSANNGGKDWSGVPTSRAVARVANDLRNREAGQYLNLEREQP